MRASRLALIALLVSASVSHLHSQSPSLDSLDAFVKAQMALRQINGLSLAIIDSGRIVLARGYGVTDLTSRTPVTPTTLFQAGSISKPVAAVGALHLVEAGRVALDENVNDKLTSWKVPENRFTTREKVTLRRILSHSAGLTVHGFPGYDVNNSMPTLVQVLDGARPANTAPIRVDTTPGAIERYSGGGFTVMQQIMIDVTGMSFPRYMQETVLGPIGMNNSSYEQPQPADRAARTASGYYPGNNPVRGRWHVYPEMAAAGLWTTATDLARFAIEIQQTFEGHGHAVISPAMARQYLTEQMPAQGLGIGLRGSGPALRFSHGGRDEGFDAWLEATAQTRQGVVIMINANDNSRFMRRIADYVAQAYHWPAATGSGEPVPAATRRTHQDPARLTRYAGYYELAENQMIALAPNLDSTGLAALVGGLPDEEFLAIAGSGFGSTERDFRIEFVDTANAVVGYTTTMNGATAERRVPRVAPFPSTRTAVADPEPSLTARLYAALQAIRRGDSTFTASLDIAVGTKRDFAGGVGELEGLGNPVYIGEEAVRGRGIHRHGSDVARVRYYQVTVKDRPRYLLVHLTADNLLTDYDLVDR